MSTLSVTKTGRSCAPRLLCLHGWGFDARCWQPLLPYLAEDFELLLVNLPGFGDSLSAGACDAQAWCQTTLAAIGALLDQGPAHLLGWSLGGQLALALADHPQVRSVTALAANLQFRANPHWSCAMAADTYQQFCDNFARAPEPTLRRFYGLVAQGSGQSGRALQQQWAASVPPAVTDWQQALAALSLLDLRDKSFAKPAQLLLASGDALVPVALADQLTGRTDLRCLRLAGGHGLPLDQPALLAPLIRNFCHGA